MIEQGGSFTAPFFVDRTSELIWRTKIAALVIQMRATHEAFNSSADT
ncbi:hypothetical protein ACVIIW_005306 [Bradyrhizobium sp. USDA 4449]